MGISNKKYKTLYLASVFLPLLLTGNTAKAHNHKQTIGVIVGAATGGYLGSQLGKGGYDERQKHSRKDYSRNYRRPSNRKRDYRHPRFNNPGYYQRNFPRRGYARQNYSRRNNDSVRLVTTVTGVFFGALIGSEIGRYLDDVDRMRARQATTAAQSAPIGRRITWNNPQSYTSGTITPTRDGYSQSGQYCREFYQTVAIGGRTEDAYGVACRQPDGAWRIVQARH